MRKSELALLKGMEVKVHPLRAEVHSELELKVHRKYIEGEKSIRPD